jgi:hypothetical protein
MLTLFTKTSRPLLAAPSKSPGVSTLLSAPNLLIPLLRVKAKRRLSATLGDVIPRVIGEQDCISLWKTFVFDFSRVLAPRRDRSSPRDRSKLSSNGRSNGFPF